MRILVSAGEPSGDMHAASVVDALRARLPGTDLEGVGGPGLERSGVELLERVEHLSATGLFESAGRFPTHVRLLRDLRRRIAANRYDLVLLVDYPGFHLRLAKAASEARVPVLYYIAPQLWAWGRWRLPLLREHVRTLAVILPFEEPFFRDQGIPAVFVGHPLLDRSNSISRTDARAQLGIDPAARVLALLPGSRSHEIDRHATLFMQAAREVSTAVRGVEFVVASPPGQPIAALQGVRCGDGPTVLAAADGALCKAGTGTLEAALAGVPMVVAHRMHPLTFAAARRLVAVPYVSLVNLLVGEGLVPELLQRRARPRAVAAALRTILDPENPAARRQLEGFATIRTRLGASGAAGRVASLAERLVA